MYWVGQKVRVFFFVFNKLSWKNPNKLFVQPKRYHSSVESQSGELKLKVRECFNSFSHFLLYYHIYDSSAVCFKIKII